MAHTYKELYVLPFSVTVAS